MGPQPTDSRVQHRSGPTRPRRKARRRRRRSVPQHYEASLNPQGLCVRSALAAAHADTQARDGAGRAPALGGSVGGPHRFRDGSAPTPSRSLAKRSVDDACPGPSRAAGPLGTGQKGIVFGRRIGFSVGFTVASFVIATAVAIGTATTMGYLPLESWALETVTGTQPLAVVSAGTAALVGLGAVVAAVNSGAPPDHAGRDGARVRAGGHSIRHDLLGRVQGVPGRLAPASPRVRRCSGTRCRGPDSCNRVRTGVTHP